MKNLRERSDSLEVGHSRETLGGQLSTLRAQMTSVAPRFAPDRASAEDIVQNRCEKALRKLSQFRGHARLSTWLHRIVVNEALMWIRSEKRRAVRHRDVDVWGDCEWVEPGPDPVEALASLQRAAGLRTHLEALPTEEREVLVRCALEETRYQDFSDEQGIRPGAAESRTFRGRQRLRSAMQSR
ncbi:MAG: RNA polymerase sigma factor [Myxococcota bacterium]